MNECKSEIKVGMKKAKWIVSAPCVGVSLTQAVDEGQRAGLDRGLYMDILL